MKPRRLGASDGSRPTEANSTAHVSQAAAASWSERPALVLVKKHQPPRQISVVGDQAQLWPHFIRPEPRVS